jgi:3-oxoacyl-(acyl-carrier-protein) synthase
LEPPIEPFAKTGKGMILSEGAGAVVVGREGFARIEMTAPGRHYYKRTEAGATLDAVYSSLAEAKIDIVIASANGTFVDDIECLAISRATPDAVVYTAKPALGEAPGASGLWQTIVGCKALVDSKLPPILHMASTAPLKTFGQISGAGQTRRVVVLSTGLNQQVAGLRLALP